MKPFTYLLLGVLLGIGGQAVAENLWSMDQYGNTNNGYYNPSTGQFSTFGPQGWTHGRIQPMQPTPFAPTLRSPC